MGVYKRIVITDNGNELISQALAGEKIIRFLRASTSDICPITVIQMGQILLSLQIYKEKNKV